MERALGRPGREGSLENEIGLGCMRLSTARDRDEARSIAVVHAALDAGVRLFDTAPSYALDETELHHNERLLRRALGEGRAARGLTVITKAGLTRAGRTFIPDGRRKAIEASAHASVEALGGPLDVLLLHAVDPRVPLSTSVRALEALRSSGIATAIGICNVSRTELERALDLADLSVVQLAASLDDDSAVRGGALDLAQKRGLRILLHTPLGGPKRAGRLAADPVLAPIGSAHGVSAVQVALSFLRTEWGTPLVGAGRSETAAEIRGALALVLTPEERERIRARRAIEVQRGASNAEVVLLIGSQGAGKSRHASELEGRGMVRLNRDDRGGTLRGLAGELAARLSGWSADPSPAAGLVLDNTYGTRAQRADVLRIANGAGARARGIWLDTPLPVAQANVVRRIVSVLGRLPTPEELKKNRDPRIVPPSALFRYARTFEAPQKDEGFMELERRPFLREPSGVNEGLAIAMGALARMTGAEPWLNAQRRVLVFGWAPDPSRHAELRARTEHLFGEQVELALCEHGEGPPICWCRPPLPGLVAAWIETAQIDAARSVLVGSGRIERVIAEATGLSYRELDAGS